MSSMPLEPTALSRRSAEAERPVAPESVSEKPGRILVPGTDHRSGNRLAVPEPIPLAKVIPLPQRRHSVVQPEDREAGMATAEYAIATLAAVAFAALLVAVLSSGDVRELLMSLIRAALSFG